MAKKMIKELNLDTSHFTGQGWLKGGRHNFSNSRTLEELLVEKSFYSSNVLKKRLIAANILESKCKECNISEWNGKPLSLHLDHINGIHSDNRLENLRILCPNCHSQTETYCKSKNGRYRNRTDMPVIGNRV
jgi:Zn finger protein HypA/HybF involved in hydrogenase expression